MPDVRIDIDLTDRVITDLTRLWRAERDGAPRPAVLTDDAAELHAAYRRASQTATDPALVAFYQRRAAEAAEAAAQAA